MDQEMCLHRHRSLESGAVVTPVFPKQSMRTQSNNFAWVYEITPEPAGLS